MEQIWYMHLSQTKRNEDQFQSIFNNHFLPSDCINFFDISTKIKSVDLSPRDGIKCDCKKKKKKNSYGKNC